jgi:nucleotide-binding universal stress UspA family protein
MAETIVVGTDGSETAAVAVKEAMRLARALGAELHLVSAFEPERVNIKGAPEGAAKVWAPLPDSKVEAILSEHAAACRIDGVPATTHAVRSDPADALLQTAEEVDAAMIVVGSRGMHGARRVLGSVPNKVSHRASRSVLIVHTSD